MTTRQQLAELVVPLFGVGFTALTVRLLQETDGASSATYLAPSAVALVLGLRRPGLFGSLGAWLGWSTGVAFGWMIDTGEFWFTGPAAYGLLVALIPHAIGSAIRTVFGRRGNEAGLPQRP